MATYNAPIDPPYVPSTSSGGLSATTITQIVIGVGLVFVPVVICCVCGSTWIASKLRRRPREEYVDEEIVFDSMGQAIFVSRRQRTWLDVPTYKEVELVEVDSEGRWIEIQPLAAAFRAKDNERLKLPPPLSPFRAPRAPSTPPLFPALSPSAPPLFTHVHHEPQSPMLIPSFLDISFVVRMPQPHSQSSALKDYSPSPNLHRDDLVIATKSNLVIMTDEWR